MTIIQDEASSLIWGMPGSAHTINAHVKECSISNVAKEILAYASLDRSSMKEVK